MYLNEKEWKPVEEYIPSVIDNMYYISIHGEICDGEKIYKPDYPSSNGYNYTTFMTKDGTCKIFQIDMLMVFAFDMIDEGFIGKRIRVKHIDGDTRNDDISNLCVVEDVEEWRIITYPNVKMNKYEISNFGNIRLHDSTRPITKMVDKRYGYVLAHTTQQDGSDKILFVHRLVSWEFLKETRDMSLDVNHIDGIKLHNYPANLEWVTRKANLNHVSDTGLNQKDGEQHPHAKMNNVLAEQVCAKLVELNGSIQETVNYFADNGIFIVDPWNVERIKYKKEWVFISDKYFTKDQFKGVTYGKINPDLSDEMVAEICKILLENDLDIRKSFEPVYRKFPGVSHRQLYTIKMKKEFKEISDRYF